MKNKLILFWVTSAFLSINIYGDDYSTGIARFMINRTARYLLSSILSRNLKNPYARHFFPKTIRVLTQSEDRLYELGAPLNLAINKDAKELQNKLYSWMRPENLTELSKSEIAQLKTPTIAFVELFCAFMQEIQSNQIMSERTKADSIKKLKIISYLLIKASPEKQSILADSMIAYNSDKDAEESENRNWLKAHTPQDFADFVEWLEQIDKELEDYKANSCSDSGKDIECENARKVIMKLHELSEFSNIVAKFKKAGASLKPEEAASEFGMDLLSLNLDLINRTILRNLSTRNVSRFQKFTLFLSAITAKQDAEQIERTLQIYADSANSFRSKRADYFSIFISGYLGLQYGRENPKAYENPFNTFDINRQIAGIFAPIGLEFTTSLNGYSLGILFSFLDIGNAINAELNGNRDQPLTIAKLATPGAHLIFGFKNYPIVIGSGFQFGQNISSDINISREWRWNIFIAMDIPIFGIY